MRKKSKVELVKRELFPQLIDWLREPEILAISGPRQSGKTTLLNLLHEHLVGQKTVLVSFEDTDQLESFLRSPEGFVSLHLEEKRKTFFLFDEFQYVEGGGKILKLLFDKFPQAKFIITGSSSLKIREIASFLVGRVIFFNLYPFSFSEYLSFKELVLFTLWKKFNRVWGQFLNGQKEKLPDFIWTKKMEALFEEYLTFGDYPAVVTSTNKKEEKLKNLMETYIEKDITKYLKIGNFLAFKNFAKVLSSQTGNLLNYSSLSQDSTLSFKEIKKFLGNLEQTFIVKLVSPFFSNRTTEIKKSPKVYFLDLGLRNSLINDFREIKIRPEKGALVENFVFANLFFRKETDNLSFWRTKQGAEVDFILRFKNEIIPIEVKYQDFKKPKLSRSFLSFLKTYSPKKGLVLNKNLTVFYQYQQTEILFFPLYFV